MIALITVSIAVVALSITNDMVPLYVIHSINRMSAKEKSKKHRNLKTYITQSNSQLSP